MIFPLIYSEYYHHLFIFIVWYCRIKGESLIEIFYWGKTCIAVAVRSWGGEAKIIPPNHWL